jgi:hypothetical protein
MTERVCAEHEVLIGYFYDELSPIERRGFERHLQQCDVCRDTLEGFGQVREGLGVWEPPDVSLAVDVTAATGPRAAAAVAPDASAAGLHRQTASGPVWMPWARAAAIVLMAGAGIAAANLQVTIARGSVTLSTGWLAPLPAASGDTSRPLSPVGVSPVADPGTEPAWRADLTRLESTLREELATARTAVPVSTPRRSRPAEAGELSLDRVRSLIAESEQRQQRELALRLTQFGRDVDQQRRTDLVRINQGFGQFEGRTGAEIARQRQMIDYIMRVSAPPPQQ